MGSVAESGTTVLLSSHLLVDLERVCDHLIVLHAARVQLTGGIEDLVAAHRQLVGPRHDGGPVAGVAKVVRASHTDRVSRRHWALVKFGFAGTAALAVAAAYGLGMSWWLDPLSRTGEAGFNYIA